jgi:hypothetical protein
MRFYYLTDIYMCMHACIYACMYVFMHACMYLCMHVCLHACMYLCMHVCLHACMFACMYVFMHACMFACWNVHSSLMPHLYIMSRARVTVVLELLQITLPRGIAFVSYHDFS